MKVFIAEVVEVSERHISFVACKWSKLSFPLLKYLSTRNVNPFLCVSFSRSWYCGFALVNSTMQISLEETWPTLMQVS